MRKTESLSGYIVDYNCARRWPVDEIFRNARMHSKECSLEGTAIESGFVLVPDPQTILLVDPNATPLIIDILLSSENEIGIQLRIERELRDNEMRSVLVTEI